MAARAIWVVLCAALLVLAVARAFLAYQGEGRFSLLWGLLGVVGFLGTVVAGFAAFFDSFQADCPACGAPVRPLSKLATVPALCRSCARWSMNTTAELELLAEDAVIDEPELESELPKGARWPGACPTCGAPSTRTVELEVQYASNRGGGTGRKEAVPACGEHEPGVKLLRLGFRDLVHFRSIRYWRSFSEENGTLPRPRGG